MSVFKETSVCHLLNFFPKFLMSGLLSATILSSEAYDLSDHMKKCNLSYKENDTRIDHYKSGCELYYNDKEEELTTSGANGSQKINLASSLDNFNKIVMNAWTKRVWEKGFDDWINMGLLSQNQKADPAIQNALLISHIIWEYLKTTADGIEKSEEIGLTEKLNLNVDAYLNRAVDFLGQKIEIKGTVKTDVSWYLTNKKFNGKKFIKQNTYDKLCLDKIKKSGYEITSDIMMIIGKYLETNSDFVNVMKVKKEYGVEETNKGNTYGKLVNMYKMNPISDTSLFPNIQTQHFYKEEDKNNKKPGMFHYIDWVTYKDYEDQRIVYKHVTFNQKTAKICAVIEQKGEGDEKKRVLKIPEGVTEIPDKAFSEMNTFDEISWPSTLRIINNGAFYGCKINNLSLPECVVYKHPACYLDGYFESCKMLKSVTIPAGIEEIPKKCFVECEELSELSLPYTLRKIGSYAFYGTGLIEITIPKNVNYIGAGAFGGTKLKSVIILQDDKIKIGDAAFWGIHTLESFTIKASSFIKTLPDQVFFNSSLNNLYLRKYVLLNDENLRRIAIFRNATIHLPKTSTLGDMAACKNILQEDITYEQDKFGNLRGYLGKIDSRNEVSLPDIIADYDPESNNESKR